MLLFVTLLLRNCANLQLHIFVPLTLAVEQTPKIYSRYHSERRDSDYSKKTYNYSFVNSRPRSHRVSLAQRRISLPAEAIHTFSISGLTAAIPKKVKEPNILDIS